MSRNNKTFGMIYHFIYTFLLIYSPSFSNKLHFLSYLPTSYHNSFPCLVRFFVPLYSFFFRCLAPFFPFFAFHSFLDIILSQCLTPVLVQLPILFYKIVDKTVYPYEKNVLYFFYNIAQIILKIFEEDH